jgi:WXXGXW repeat (2 copies)
MGVTPWPGVWVQPGESGASMNNMRGAALLTLTFLLAGCVVAQPVVQAPPPPPPLQGEIAPAAPGPAYVWVAGHWSWRGQARGYVWKPGRWAIPEAPGYVWVPGRWVPRHGGYAWIDGHWRAP